MTTISVALTTHNGARFLQRQLDSIAAQTRPPDELVVSDDASQDGTWAMLGAFAASAPFRVRLHRNETALGWRHNFMHALSLTTGDLIALCDQDDMWEADKLAVAEAALAAPDALLFYHDAWLIDEADRRFGTAGIFPLPPVNPPLSVHSPSSPYGFSMVLNRALLQFSDLWPVSLESATGTPPAAHDQWLFFLATIFGTVLYSERRLGDYRRHGSNTCGEIARVRFPRTREDWAYWLTNPAEGYRRLARTERNRAEILALCQPRVPKPWRARAAEGERRCLHFARQFDRRALIYGRGSIASRIRLLMELRGEGMYGAATDWTFPRAALKKDVLLGLLMKPFLMEPEPGGQDGSTSSA